VRTEGAARSELFTREESYTLKKPTFHDSLLFIKAQQACCDYSLRCNRFDDPAHNAKVIRPPIQP
jgi:hypothetical protein